GGPRAARATRAVDGEARGPVAEKERREADRARAADAPRNRRTAPADPTVRRERGEEAAIGGLARSGSATPGRGARPAADAKAKIGRDSPVIDRSAGMPPVIASDRNGRPAATAAGAVPSGDRSR